MKLTLAAAIAIAREHNACQDSLLKIEELGSWGAIIAHPALVNWVSWWHDNVAPLPAYDAYDLAIKGAFEAHDLAHRPAREARDLAFEDALSQLRVSLLAYLRD